MRDGPVAPQEQRPGTMSKSNEPQILTPPNLLGMKMGAGAGKSKRNLDPKLLAEAEDALASFKEDFPGVLMREVRRMTADFETYLLDPEAGREALAALRATAFDIKGQGGSVGFAIVSRIGETLYRLLEGRDRLAARDVEILRAHIEALRAIAVNRCAGEGGEVGREITQALDLLTARNAG